MKIVLGGKSGTGKSAIGRMLAEKLGFEFMSGGNIMRKVAVEQGMTIEELDAKMRSGISKELDFLVDGEQKKFGETHDNFIIDAHLGWYNIPDAIKIKLFCEDNVRFERTSKKDPARFGSVVESFEATKKKSLEREENLKNRIKDLYGVENLHSDEHFDFVLDTTLLNQEEVLAEILKFLDDKKV